MAQLNHVINLYLQLCAIKGFHINTNVTQGTVAIPITYVQYDFMIKVIISKCLHQDLRLWP